MRELDCEESRAPKNWCFWTVVLKKTLECPLDCKEIKPVHSKGDQPWVFFGRNDAKAETPVPWPPHVKSWLIGKDSDAGRDWGQEEKGKTEDETAGWHHWLDGRKSEWTLGDGDGKGGLACCDSWSCKVGHDWRTELNWMKIMETSFKRSHACTAILSAPNPAAGHHQLTPPPETPEHSWASLGQSLAGSLLLSPGSWSIQHSVCALQTSVSQSCVSSGSSMVGLMETSSKSAYAIPRSTTPTAHVLAAVHSWPVPPQETLKGRSGSGSMGFPGVQNVLFEPSDHLWQGQV